MTRSELQALKTKATAGDANINDVLLIVASAFESQTKNINEIKLTLETFQKDIDLVKEQLETIERMEAAAIHIGIIEDESEEDDDENIIGVDDFVVESITP